MKHAGKVKGSPERAAGIAEKTGAKPRGRIGSSMKFLIVSCMVYAAAWIVSPETAMSAISVFARIVAGIVPAFVLVFVMMFAMDMLLKPSKIVKYLGSGSGLKGWLIAMAGGIISAGPIYAWYPMLADLRDRGMKDSLMAAFLYSRAVKIPLIPVLVYYFGWTFTVVLVIYMIGSSIISGMIVGFRGGVKNEDSG